MRLRIRLLAIAVVLALTVPVTAQSTYRTFEQITVANTAIGFTSSLITAQTSHPQATWARCRLRTAEISIRGDGTAATASVGQLVEIGDLISFNSLIDLVNFSAIRTGATSGQLDCHYGNGIPTN